MFEFMDKILKPATRQSVVAQLEEQCGDELSHGQNQVLSSMAELEDRLSFSDEKERAPVCFAIDCTGFWEQDLARHWTISQIASEEQLSNTRIPVYIYALHEGASYKVAFSSRYLPEFKNKRYEYYSEVLADLGVHAAKADVELAFMFKSSTYSSDILTILRGMEKQGQLHAVYRLV